MIKNQKPLFNLMAISRLNDYERLTLIRVISSILHQGYHGNSFNYYAVNLINALSLVYVAEPSFEVMHEPCWIGREDIFNHVTADRGDTVNTIRLPWSARISFVRAMKRIKGADTVELANRVIGSAAFLNLNELNLFKSILM
jgi:hypothetical protein